jgi:hypothetical protein
MIFGNVVKVVEDGFQIARSTMERIGIFDNSVCWGVWVRDPRPDGGDKLPHLLISPNHPSVWPYLLRCEIKLCHAPGCMARASQILVDNKINIQFGECAPSGHHHATWNIVAEVVSIRRELLARYKHAQTLHPKDMDNLELKAFSNELASHMFRMEQTLTSALVNAHKEEFANPEATARGFLHDRIVEKIPLFYDPEEITLPEIKEAAWAGFPKPVTCQWMQNLAFFSIYGEVESPIRFQYNAATSTLRLTEFGRLQRSIENMRVRAEEYVPSRAHASIDTTEQSLRLDLLRAPAVRKKFVQVQVHYEGRFRKARLVAEYDVGGSRQRQPEEDTTAGLWLSICKQLAEHSINLSRISNRTTVRDTGQETGDITLIGEAPQELDEQTNDALKAILELNCAPTDITNFKVRVGVNGVALHKIFISARSNTPRGNELREIITTRSARWGIEPLWVRDRLGRSVPEEVEREFKSSVGLLQLISFSTEEITELDNQRTTKPDLQWLLYEYGLAGGLDLPRRRLVDTSTWPLRRWREHLRINRDEFLPSISFRDDPAKIAETIDSAIQSLARDIAKRDVSVRSR